MLALQGSFYLTLAAPALTARAPRWLSGIALTLATAGWLLRLPSAAVPAAAPVKALGR